jgi:hypothetical protein
MNLVVVFCVWQIDTDGGGINYPEFQKWCVRLLVVFCCLCDVDLLREA